MAFKHLKLFFYQSIGFSFWLCKKKTKNNLDFSETYQLVPGIRDKNITKLWFEVSIVNHLNAVPSTSLKLDFLLLNLRWEKLKPTFNTASCPRLNHFRCPPDCSNKLTIDWTRAISFSQIQKLRTKDIDSGRFDVMGRFTSWFIANTYYNYWTRKRQKGH